MSETISGIKGKVRAEGEGFSKIVGLGEVKVLIINPTREEFKEILGRDLDENSKADQYLGEKDGNTQLRLDVWVETLKGQKKEKITIFLENKERVNQAGTKKQFVNAQGATTWADEEENLKAWFTKHDYRVARSGEEELYTFLRAWMGKLDFRDAESALVMDWKKLMKGNVTDVRNLAKTPYVTTFVASFEVKTTEKDGEIKSYQTVYNKMYLPAYSLKFFRTADYSKDELLNSLRAKLQKKLKPHEKFAVQVADPEHGSKNSWKLKDFSDYNPEDFLVAGNETLDESDSDR